MKRSYLNFERNCLDPGVHFNSLSDFIEQIDGKTLGHMAGHAVGGALFQATTGSLAAKGVAMGAQGLGDLVSQAATFIGKADKNPDARKALEQLAAEGKIDTSAPVKTGAGDGTMPVEGVVSEKWFSGYLNNKTNPEIKDAFITQADGVRLSQLADFDGKGNLALANVDIPGLPSQLKAFSQFQKGENGFVALPEGQNILQPLSVNKYGVVDGKDSFSRIFDGEFKILETTARALGTNTSAMGRIDLFTELKACTSCGGAIQQFRAMYPNIQLNVFTNK